MTSQHENTNQGQANGNSSSLSGGAHRYRAAFESVKEELDALPDDELIKVNLDIPAAVMAAIGRAPEIVSHRAAVAEQMPKFDVSCFDKLETYALAAGYAHTQYVAASGPPGPIQALNDELTKTRELFVADVSLLAKRGLLDGSKLSQLLGATGYKNVAFDVMVLSSMLREHWASIEGKTAVTLADLDRAEDAADQLVTAVGLRDEGQNVVTAVVRTRQRAFTKFVNAYEETLRALTFLRWNDGDIDRIAPSLYGGRGSRRKAEREVVASPAAPADPGTGGNVAPSNGGAVPVTQGAASAASAAPAGKAPVAPGLPGSDPFGR